MRPYVLAACVAATLAGGGGYLLGRASPAEREAARDRDASQEFRQAPPSERFISRDKLVESPVRSVGQADENRHPQPTEAVERVQVGGDVREQRKQGSTRAEAASAATIEKERDACVRELNRHRDLAGTPIEAPKEVPARLGQTALAQAYTTAFTQTGVAGKLDSIDCSEHPCIVFSSIRGDEELAEKVEHAKALRTYDDDIGTMLMWAITDDAAKRDLSQPKPPELTLTAVAWVTRAQHEALGQNLDRRIRTRVAEYWNATRPSDQQ